MEYCSKLIYLYERYVSSGEYSGHRSGGDSDLESRVAVVKCHEGKTAEGIPVLERKLRANGFTLPKRN